MVFFRMSFNHTPRSWLRGVLQHGVGRYVCQLQRVTLEFCKSDASSRGMRDFIERDLLDFTRENPGVVVYLNPRRHNQPALRAEYLNGNTQLKEMNNRPREEICQWLEHFRCRSGLDIVHIQKSYHTDSPSMQGIWTPQTNKPSYLNVTEFPCESESRKIPSGNTATERLLQQAAALQVKE